MCPADDVRSRSKFSMIRWRCGTSIMVVHVVERKLYSVSLWAMRHFIISSWG